MNRKKRSDYQRYTPVPDSVMQSSQGQLSMQIDPNASEMLAPDEEKAKVLDSDSAEPNQIAR